MSEDEALDILMHLRNELFRSGLGEFDVESLRLLYERTEVRYGYTQNDLLNSYLNILIELLSNNSNTKA